jgi:processive 1,2-diacylglycerol beta-glucosyltransferase
MTMRGSAPRILILTSSLGSGHVMGARAIAVALRERRPEAAIETVDFWSLMDPWVAGALRGVYLQMLAEEPECYDAVYRLGQGTWRGLFEHGAALPEALETFIARYCARLEQADGDTLDTTVAGDSHPTDRLLLQHLRASLARRQGTGKSARPRVRPTLFRWVWARLAGRLEQRFKAFRPDAVVATQMGPAALAASIKSRRRLALPMVAVPTDFGIHDFWLQPGFGWYCVAHPSVSHPRMRPEAEQLATGMPLMPGFRGPPAQPLARLALGLAEQGPLVLVAGGGLGLGVAEVAARILDEVPGVRVAAMAGSNASARSPLEALKRRFSTRLVVRGWTDRMADWISAADIVVGKPGGLTLAESLACGRPLLAIRSPGGQEGFNVRFMASERVGAALPEAELGLRVRTLLADPAGLSDLKARAFAAGRRDGAARIAELVTGIAMPVPHPSLARGRA